MGLYLIEQTFRIAKSNLDIRAYFTILPVKLERNCVDTFDRRLSMLLVHP